MSFVLIFDADNTLWDTNAVFHAAHTAMLEVLAKAQLVAAAPDQVTRLRTIDRALMQHFGRHEYDFQTLVVAIVAHSQHGLPPDQAAAYATAKGAADFDPFTRAAITQAHAVHTKTLAQLPPLVPGVMEMLTHLHTSRAQRRHISMVLFSEGHPDRLEQTLTAYRLRQEGYFDEIVMERKSTNAFTRVGALGRQYVSGTATHDVTTVVIGDSMTRDVRPANAVGFTTVYVPSQFEGQERPQRVMDHPDFQIGSLRELPSILASLGLELSHSGSVSHPPRLGQ